MSSLAPLERQKTGKKGATPPSAVSQALMAHSPPAPAAEPRTAARGPAAMDTADDSPPAWEFKSNSPAMDVLGTVYAHFLATGQSSLAADLLSVRGTIGYASIPATQVDPSDAEHVYQDPHSGKRWKTDHRHPRPCYTRGAMHWSKDCHGKAQKQQQGVSQFFPRGDPPA